MKLYDWLALTHRLSKERRCLVDLAQGCRYPSAPPHLDGRPCPWFRCKVLVDLQRLSSIALHARYDAERSDMRTPAGWAVSPLLNGLFKHHAGLVDSAAQQEHIGKTRDVVADLAASGVRWQGG